MAYEIRSEKGLQIQKEGQPVLATDTIDVKIEQLDEKNKSFVAVASTEDEDRDKDIIRQDGWKLANFKKNPVVPWSHNYYGVPIARSMKTWVDKSNPKGPRLLFQPKFDETDDDSMKIFNKYKNGFLTSFSVGFRGIEFNYRDEEERWFGGREFTKQELLEISSVAIPANPSANTHLSYMGNSVPKNLLQMGYPEVFAKTDSGLFYPVADIAIFSQPKEVQVDKGVIAIKGIPLDNDIEINDPIAYLFDLKLFNDQSANEWIRENAKQKWKVKYFDLKINEGDGFLLENIEEERPIKQFEKSVDFTDVDLSNTFMDSKDSSEDTDSKNQSDDGLSDQNIDSGSSDDEKDSNGKSIEDKSKEDTDNNTVNNNKNDTDEKEVISFPVKQFVEVVTSIKNINGEVIDTQIEMFASNKVFENVEEYKEKQNNDLIKLLKEEISGLKEILVDLQAKKDVANTGDLIHNNSKMDDLVKDSGGSKTSTNDNFIELDDSFIKSPNNDKSQSDDFIEVDEDTLTESKTDLEKTVKDTVYENLRNNLKSVLSQFSGKID